MPSVSEIAGMHVVEVAASREECVALLLDVERYPAWYDTLDSVEVVDRDAEGRAAAARVRAGAGRLGAVEFVLAYRYALPGRIEASQIGGDGRVVRIRSSWTLEARDRTTLIAYRFNAEAGGRAIRLALRAARPLVERDLIAGFAESLAREVELRRER
ncbi:MAG: hypothetical protein NVSMB25_02190 [Thermoleophilaceae bacterium]